MAVRGRLVAIGRRRSQASERLRASDGDATTRTERDDRANVRIAEHVGMQERCGARAKQPQTRRTATNDHVSRSAEG